MRYLMIVLFALCLAGSAMAATLNVGPGQAFSTIQAAIDAASAGDTIYVYPYNYSEKAEGRSVLGSGSYQFGLFIDKDNLSIIGVDDNGVEIDSYKDILANVELNSTSNFGPDGVFVLGSNVTISGLNLYQNPLLSQNKSITVASDGFTLKHCKISDGDSLYFSDWNAVGTSPDISAYTIDGNLFIRGTSIDICSGAGLVGAYTSRNIINNTFDLQCGDWPAISFNGSNTGVPWFVDSVGGAIIKGNTFKNGSLQYIRTRGDYDSSQFDWASYFMDNSFDMGTLVLDESGSAKIYSYASGTYTFNNCCRIGATVEGAKEIADSNDGIFRNVRYTVTPSKLAKTKAEYLAGANPFGYDYDSIAPGVATDAPEGFGNTSFSATIIDGAASASDRYRSLRVNPEAIFGHVVKLSDIARMSYSTKNIDSTIDWRYTIYTKPTSTNDFKSWCHTRIEANANPTNVKGAWQTWSTDSLLFTINRTGALVYDSTWNAATSGEYASNELSYFDLILGANSGGGTGTSQLDAVTIKLTNGEIAVIDLEGNALSLVSTANPLYVKKGDAVQVALNVSDLTQKIVACQAYMGYDNAFFADPTGGCVVAGGGIWNDLYWDSWKDGGSVSGEINTVIAVESKIGGTEGTQENAKIATINLTTNAEGKTNLYFLDNLSDSAGNYLSDTSIPSKPIDPALFNGTQIVIDSTLPTITDNSNLPATSTVATVTVKATVTDDNSGVASFTLDGNAFDGEEPVVLTPGANTITLAATDNCGNTATKTIEITYNQPAPQIDLTTSLAPNVYGSSTFNTWAANATSAILAGNSSNGASYAKYEDLGFANTLDFSTCMVSEGYSTWLGKADASHELGTAVHFCFKIDNGVVGNPGAAKLDLANVTGTYRYNYDGAAADNFDSYAALAGKAFGQNNWLKGYNYVDGNWVEVTSGTQADVIICVKNRVGMSSKPDQASLNALYANLAGVPDATGQVIFKSVSYGIVYSGQANVGEANTGVNDLNFGPVNDDTDPIISGPANGEIFTASTTITVTDPGDLASGVKSVTINGTAATVVNGACTASVNLVRGNNTINVVAEDNAGNTTSQTFTVFYVANRISGQITLDRFVGINREVSFFVNGKAVKANAVTLVQVGDFSKISYTANFTLTNVDGLVAGANKLSAQTKWNLRSTVSFTPSNGIGTANFTGADMLLGGDLNGSNSINVLDYGTLKSCWYTTNMIADINGDNKVDNTDYGIQKSNWFKVGDNF